MTVERQIEGEVREEIMMGNAGGEKPGSHGSKAILLVTHRRWSHHHSPSRPPCQQRQLNKREAGPSNA